MISLRKAESSAEALTALALRSKRAWGYDDDFMASVMPDMIVHPEYLRDEYGIVAEENGTSVGYAILRIDGDAAFLRDLFVEPVGEEKSIVGGGRVLPVMELDLRRR